MLHNVPVANRPLHSLRPHSLPFIQGPPVCPVCHQMSSGTWVRQQQRRQSTSRCREEQQQRRQPAWLQTEGNEADQVAGDTSPLVYAWSGLRLSGFQLVRTTNLKEALVCLPATVCAAFLPTAGLAAISLVSKSKGFVGQWRGYIGLYVACWGLFEASNFDML